ncbi:MAG: SGNH/GDSL hydrolase family protein, partial [Pseudomonadota bacterium]
IAKLPRKTQLTYLLSLKELESLTIYDRDLYLKRVTRAMAKIRLGARLDWQRSLKLFNAATEIYSLFIANAQAELNLRPVVECVGGMNVVVTSETRNSTRECPAPRSAAGYTCSEGMEICNPWHYGVYKSSGSPVCLPNATNAACAREAEPGRNTSTSMVYNYELRGITGEALERVRAEWRANSWYLQYICEGKISVRESDQDNEETCRILKAISDQARAKRAEGNADVAPVYIEFPAEMTPRSALTAEEQAAPMQQTAAAETEELQRNTGDVGNLDVLLIGDSQSEGNYGTFLRELLNDLSAGPGACDGVASQANNVSLYAVGSSSPRHWVDTGRNPDFAGWFCTSSRQMRMHLPAQRTQSIPTSRICQEGRSPFQNLIQQTDPDVVVMTFGVNSIGFRGTVRERVKTMLGQIPPDKPCLFIASPPSVLPNHQATEDQIAQALREFNAERRSQGLGTCGFVPGRSATNVNRFEANRNTYLTRDGYHLRDAGARYFAGYVASE